MDFTFLRDNFYADLLPSFAGEDGAIRGPAGSGCISAVAEDDVADAVTAIMLDPTSHVGTTYSLTGPESLSLQAVAAILSRELQRPIRYVDAERCGNVLSCRGAIGVSRLKAAVPEAMRALRGGCSTGQEIAAFTSSATFLSTMGLQFFSAYDTGHRSPSSRFAASWKPRVE
jgi:uncharacterized protein YbjT (DUF2867 family)